MSSLSNQLKNWTFWREIFIMTFGMAISAIGVYYFLMPSKIVVGSIAGLAMLLSGLLAKVGIACKVSTLILALNTVLLILAYSLLGKEFGLKTVFTSLILAPLIELFEIVLPLKDVLEPGCSSIMNDPWFDMLCFVLLISLSQAVLFRINASTGGLDIVSKILNKYLHFEIGTCVTISGVAICCTAFLLNSPRMVIIGLIATMLNGLTVDYFSAALNKRKRVCIVSDDYETIRKYIINDLQRGCSLYPLKGGYTLEDKWEIQVLLTQIEFAQLMKFLKKNDIKAFTTAGNVNEVYGLWNIAKRAGKKK